MWRYCGFAASASGVPTNHWGVKASRHLVMTCLFLAVMWPAAVPAELLDNGGFENGGIAPWQALGTADAQAGAGRNGTMAARVASGSGAGATLTATPGASYQYSGWGRTNGQQGGAQLFIKFFDSNWNVTGQQTDSTPFNTGWSQKTLQVVAPASAVWVQAAVWNSAGQPLYLDDMSLTIVGDGGAEDSGGNGGQQGGGSNMLTNPGFESGVALGWQGWSAFFAATGQARSGAYSAHVPNNNGGGLFVPVTSPGNVQFNAWGKTSGSGWAGLIIKAFDSQWQVVTTERFSSGFTAGWSEQQVSLEVPAGAAHLQLSAWNGSGSTLYLDDLSLRLAGSSQGGEAGGGSNNGGSDGGQDTGTDQASGITLAGPSVTGTRYYVAPAGSGVSTNRAQPGAVTATVRRVCNGNGNAIGGGDAIVFLDGEYLTSQFSLGFSADANQPGHGGQAIAMVNRRCGGPGYIHLLAENRHQAVIRNDVNWTNHSGGFDVRNSSYIWIEGFRVEGINQASVPFEQGVSVGYGSDHAVIRHNRINRVGGGGIGINRATRIRVEYNDVQYAAGQHPFCASGISFFKADNPFGYGDDANGYSNYIVGNRVAGTRTRYNCDSDADPSNGVASWDGNCIVLDQFAEHQYNRRTLVESNLCVDNGGGGVHLYNSGYTDILNNTVYASGRVSLEGALSVSCTNQAVLTTNVRFANNLVHTWDGTPLTATDFGLGCLGAVEHRHNVFVSRNPQAGNIRGTTVSLTSDAGLLADCSSGWNLQSVGEGQVAWANPGTTGTADDFAIQAGSVARNLASCALPPALSTDHNGNPRQRGGRSDIGAFEYQQ